LKNHLKECHKKRTKKERWLYELKCLGKKPIVEILEEIKTDEWENAEIYWIAQLKCWNFKLLNGTEGGEGSNGFKGKTHSEETKNKIRIKATGKRYTSKYTGEDGTNAKLNKKQVDEIKEQLKNRRAADIAKEYNVSKTCIFKIAHGYTWK